ncbi:MAG TPA: recombinase family protein [Methylococcaceae bacterium]|nr:recombinase family protein [Methylococcaceae bacterium]
MYPGDTIVVCNLDRLAWSWKQLVETIELLARCWIGFRSLMESSTTAGGKLVFHVFGSLGESCVSV